MLAHGLRRWPNIKYKMGQRHDVYKLEEPLGLKTVPYLPICSAVLMNLWEKIDSCMVSRSVPTIFTSPSPICETNKY